MKTILVILSLLLPAFATAGVSSEDPMVALLRQRFSQGKAPTSWHLENTYWDCTRFSAVRGVFSRDDFYNEEFVGKNGFYETAPPGPGLMRLWPAETFILSGKELTTIYGWEEQPDYVLYRSYRVDEKGGVYGELSIKKRNGPPNFSDARESSVTVPSGVADAYFVCQVLDRETRTPKKKHFWNRF